MKKINCITNKMYLDSYDDTNMLYIMAIIDNTDITWHLVKKNSNNTIMINNIYDYFKKLYNNLNIEIEHNDDIHLYRENISEIIDPFINGLFIRVYL